ncbi:MgtC/SapB family protein [Falsiroseomonas sp. HW251]|uniref:MgtC/SapB family protein n=1 Tax=Falsiroseomonas sp. HW251 TaxID=3390998 RepID=UPI003D312E07
MGTDPETLIRRLAVALAIGLLVGAERHWRERDEAAGSRTMGVRTFGLIGLFGGVMAALGAELDGIGTALMVAGGLGALVATVLPFALREAAAAGSVGATTPVAALATYALGALAVLGAPQAAGAAAVAMTAVLAARESLHELMARITWAELRSAIVLLSMTLLVLPLVPDAPVAWLAGVNPHEVWMLAILLAGVSFAGYLAERLAGAGKGLLLAGAAGGLVSSTAVTLGNAGAAAQGGSAVPLAAGALVAGAVACLRTLVLVFIVSPDTAWRLAAALLAAAAAMGIAATLLARRGMTALEDGRRPDNPFELKSVLRMALLLGGVGAVAKLAATHFGQAAVVAVAALTGLADVDAIALSVPLLAPATVTTSLAATAVAVAVASNIVAKAGYAAALGRRAYAVPYCAGSAAALAAGGVALFLV